MGSTEERTSCFQYPPLEKGLHVTAAIGYQDHVDFVSSDRIDNTEWFKEYLTVFLNS